MSTKLKFSDDFKKLTFEDRSAKLKFSDNFKKLVFDITLPVNLGYPYTYPMLLS